MNKSTIAIIPARGGSKRLPQKNTKTIGNLPLIVHSILYAKKHKFINEIYVTTDDKTIKKIALEYGAKVIDRPDSLSGDLEPTVSALKHVLLNIKDDVANVVLLQPTNPLRPENLLKEAFLIFQEKKCNSLFTVSQNHQKFGKIIDKKFIPFNYEIGQRSQDLEPLYFENGLLYISKSELIFNNSIIDRNAYPMIIDHPFSEVDIDTIEDFEYAEYLFNKKTNS
ncbi:acylneuraminate cytidylyltransferase family protein [Flavobacterium oreochromis]|uniref:Acylneuraminate cytidylyltransferase n=2 Tax=Flavobacterium TaxID=237 RepID=A0A246GE10_9FLAO|nr:acylneuraminate cytidylyltransferase family protein [Flavobacterium oreochromis]OWP76033.1 acylneuraminate cytidylyltransferase [Flavobacterium oreochromis]OWP79617.1 acylneuraminate cytidylyltransferase [Flavobacterium oreochromis]POR23995.1 acylneuraminate cytidylyltransferase [Flavobacterium columnare]QYS86591.1 acylneuraminate cytidylyltransferase family protein [Flavobacterium oreochromis]